jgi:5S rRNA maturation endonuclease (ribonuclease M5)
LDPNETLERLLRLFLELDEVSRSVPVIVEGRYDRKALNELGVKGRIVVLNDGRSILGTCEELSKENKSAVIMTDWDRRGGQLARLLIDALESCDMKHNTDIRAQISYLAKKETKDVEGLPAFILRLRKTTGRPA